MALLSARFAPYFLVRLIKLLINDHLVLLVFISLLKYSFDHCCSFFQILLILCCNQHIQWLIFISFLLVIYLPFILRPNSSHLYLTFALFLQFLLCLTTWTNDLTYIVEHWIIWIRNVDLFGFTRWLIVRWWLY